MVVKQESKAGRFKRVRLEGGSVVVTLGSLIPKEWQMVELKTTEADGDKSRTIQFIKVA